MHIRLIGPFGINKYGLLDSMVYYVLFFTAAVYMGMVYS